MWSRNDVRTQRLWPAAGAGLGSYTIIGDGFVVGVCPQGGFEFLATSSKSAGPQRDQELINYRHVRSQHIFRSASCFSSPVFPEPTNFTSYWKVREIKKLHGHLQVEQGPVPSKHMATEASLGLACFSLQGCGYAFFPRCLVVDHNALELPG